MTRPLVRRCAAFAALVLVPGALLGWAGAALLKSANVLVSPVYLAAVAAVALALFRLGRFALADLEVPAPQQHGPVAEPLRRPEMLAPLERRLANATREGRLFDIGVRAMLYDLARERVRLHSGVDLDALRLHDPERGRELLGDDAWQLLVHGTAEGPPPTAEQLAELVGTVQRL